MNYFVECVFEGAWEFRAGEDYQPGVALPAKPPRATFDTFRESQRVLGTDGAGAWSESFACGFCRQNAGV
jgi:hypothetical protein